MENLRFDKYLQQKYPQLSRDYLKTQIKLGNFLVGNKKVKPSYILREPDLVGFAQRFSLPDAAQILPNPKIKLNIIYEDQNVIVINKPAGLSVHPRADKNGLPLLSEIDSTMVSGLLAYYPEITNVRDATPSFLKEGGGGFKSPLIPPYKGGNRSAPLAQNLSSATPLTQRGVGGLSTRPGIVHRLDKDTSGVMIVAKNQSSFDWLKKQFQRRQVNKTYLALVHGKLRNKAGEIKTLLSRAKQNPTKQAVSLTQGKEAVTQYKVIREFKDYTLLEAMPKTGRLHQIRVHLAHIGHPVVGDKKYGSQKLLTPEDLTRQFLHAQQLEITLPDGQKKTFNAPLPSDLDNGLQALENR